MEFEKNRVIVFEIFFEIFRNYDNNNLIISNLND